MWTKPGLTRRASIGVTNESGHAGTVEQYEPQDPRIRFNLVATMLETDATLPAEVLDVAIVDPGPSM